MNFYRSVSGANGGASDYSYTTQANGQPLSTVATRMFANNSTFNADLTVGSMVTDCAAMLYNCAAFNGNVNFGANVLYCDRALYNCQAFNSNVTFKNNTVSLYMIFENCIKYNKPVTFPLMAENFSFAFASCSNYNQHLTITNNAVNCSYMLYGCTNYIQDNITIPASVNDCRRMLTGCRVRNIYINGTPDLNGIIFSKNNNFRTNIYSNNIATLNMTGTNSLVGAAITWSSMTNGYYNAAYNVYIYNNYSA